MNEVAGCRHDVPAINRGWFEEIYAVDGHSTDGTIEYLHAQQIPVHLQPRKSLNAAVSHAFEKCTTDAVVLFHPKGSVDPIYLQQFRGLFESGADLVVASRVIKGAHNEEDTRLLKPRKWFVVALALTTAALFRARGNMVWDVLHGFRGMRLAAYRIIAPSNVGVSIDIEMVARAYKKHLSCVEFPMTENPRLSGATHFKAIPTGWQLIRYILREIPRRD
jgi:glycosyltransferase involved in cell wall biosynthesis